MHNRKFHFDNVFFENAKIYDSFQLFQIGDLMSAPSLTVNFHTQVCHEITLAVSGEAVCYTNDKKFHIKKGDIHFCAQSDKHAIYTDFKNPLRYFYLGFNLSEQSPLKPILTFLCENRYKIVNDNLNLYSKFCNIFGELIYKNDYSEMYIKNELENILIATYKNFAFEEDLSYIHPDNFSSLVYEIVRYLDDNIKNISVLSELPNFFGYSYNHLSRIFNINMGISLRDYVKNKRFDLAASYLLSGKYSITQISDDFCFNTIHAFSRAFKNHFGVSPSEYKEKNGKK